MAIAGSLLLTLVLSTAVAGMLLVGAIERRAAASYRVRLELRAAANSAAVLAAAELQGMEAWGPAFAGAGSVFWREPSASIDVAAETARLRNETVMAAAHGADTPVWQVFVQTSWGSVTRSPSAAHVVAWVADDWAESDGDALADTNGLILVRAAAFEGPATGWVEVLYSRGEDGRLERRQSRSW